MDGVTREDMNKLEKKMDAGFSAVEKQIAELAHKIEVGEHITFEKADQRYRRRGELLQDATSLFGEQQFVDRCNQLIGTYLLSPDGMRDLRECFGKIVQEGRDNVTKWISAAKIIAGAVAALVLGYLGINLMQSQSAILEMMKTLCNQ